MKRVTKAYVILRKVLSFGLWKENKAKMPKLLVERISGKKSTIKKYPVKEGRVIISKGGLGPKDLKYDPIADPSRIAETEGVLGFFKKQKAYYLDGAKELSPLDPGGERPEFSAEYILKAAKTLLLRQQARVKGQTQGIMYIVVFGIFIIIGMLFLLMVNSGVINIA